MILSLAFCNQVAFSAGFGGFHSSGSCESSLVSDLSVLRRLITSKADRFGLDFKSSFEAQYPGRPMHVSLADGTWIQNPSNLFYCSVCGVASDRIYVELVKSFPSVAWKLVTTIEPFRGLYLHDYVIGELKSGETVVVDPTIRQFFHVMYRHGEISKKEFDRTPKIFVGSKKDVIGLFESFGISEWPVYLEYSERNWGE